MLRLAIPVLAALLLGLTPPLAARSKGGKLESGKVCFPEGCLKVLILDRTQPAAHKSQPSCEEFRGCILELRDAEGKTIDRVQPGGRIVPISLTAYAKREPGAATFTLYRRGARRGIKTPFVRIVPHLVEKDEFAREWRLSGDAALGSTEPRTTPPLGFSEHFTSDQEDVGKLVRLRAPGMVGGLTPEGTVTELLGPAHYVLRYGDYRVIAHADHGTFTVADADYRPLLRRIENVAVFFSWYDENKPLGFADERIVLAVKSQQIGGRQFYQLLPPRAVPEPDPGLIGLLPMVGGWWKKCPTEWPYYARECTTGLRGWIAVHASEEGPLLTVLDVYAEKRHSEERYRYVGWEVGTRIEAGVVQRLDGRFQLVTQVDALHPLVPLPEVYPSLEAARRAIAAWNARESAEFQRRREEAYRAELARYEAWLREQEARRREEQRRFALERQANAEADALVASGDADRICAAAKQASTPYAYERLAAACEELRALAPPPELSFGRALAMAFRAWAEAAAQGGPAYPGFGTGASLSDSASLRREANLNAIGQTLERLKDPNWNGAAAAAFRR